MRSFAFCKLHNFENKGSDQRDTEEGWEGGKWSVVLWDRCALRTF
jgi:hypothetical protein